MFKYLKNKMFGYIPTLQEQQFIDIVSKMLVDPKTSLRMAPVTNRYFIINEQRHYYILLKDCGIQLTNTKFSFTKSMHPKAYDIIISNIHNHIEEHRQILEDKLFKNEMEMLDSILSKLT